ncbi:DDB1- and CUL4-associated factor 13-like isoform X2 [Corticium candelabrum]|uniref:DDB1- and CUL4-associated factor 13-like isoform X2 n=1 Tax=Corticium candelabrum TaxID=121492 RepID=UPI002E261B51|nr:DDB1- and CUL4-associated factor 13-like isoform X2 [Corticium candelabrum]
MRVKVLSRNSFDYARETKSDIHRIHRNLDPALHQLESAREYQRAINAAKLESVFAKPFVGSLSGHADGVYCMAKHPCRVSCFVSGSCDGEIRVWNLTRQRCMHKFSAHSGFVRGVVLNTTGQTIISVGDDQTIKYWPIESYNLTGSQEPLSTVVGNMVFTGIDHHWTKPIFATSSSQVDIWDETRSEPLRSLVWGADGISSVRFSPVERNILASTGSDRSIALYDIRGVNPLRKVVLDMRSNSVTWNPMEAFNFTAASEDSNLYTFDMRRLDQALCVHMDHVGAVLDCDYAPTGKEFVSGGFDRTIRIFPYNKGHSRDVYHTKRMQRVFCVKWTCDNKFVLSGSDETNIRLWKAQASEKLGSA